MAAGRMGHPASGKFLEGEEDLDPIAELESIVETYFPHAGNTHKRYLKPLKSEERKVSTNNLLTNRDG